MAFPNVALSVNSNKEGEGFNMCLVDANDGMVLQGECFPGYVLAAEDVSCQGAEKVHLCVRVHMEHLQGAYRCPPTYSAKCRKTKPAPKHFII